MVKIEVYLPKESVLPVRDALHEVGAGHIGKYDHCVSITEVSGYWRPLEGARPYGGTQGEIAFGTECKLEVLCPAPLVRDAVQAIRRVHPYEEPIINVIPLLAIGAPEALLFVPGCPFCVRDPKEVGSVVMENDHCAFLAGVESVLKGSGIIVPKAHRTTVFDLTSAEWMATYTLLAQVREQMVRELHPDGFNVGWNCGETGGQAIPHAHLHVIPRFKDEPLAGKGIRHWLKSEANRRPAP